MVVVVADLGRNRRVRRAPELWLSMTAVYSKFSFRWPKRERVNQDVMPLWFGNREVPKDNGQQKSDTHDRVFSLPASFQLKRPSIFHSITHFKFVVLIFGTAVAGVFESRVWVFSVDSMLMKTSPFLISNLTCHRLFLLLSKSGTFSNSGALINFPRVS